MKRLPIQKKYLILKLGKIYWQGQIMSENPNTPETVIKLVDAFHRSTEQAAAKYEQWQQKQTIKAESE